MQTFSSFNEMAAAQYSSPLVSDMCVFNIKYEDGEKAMLAVQQEVSSFYDTLKQIKYRAAANVVQEELGRPINPATLPLICGELNELIAQLPKIEAMLKDSLDVFQKLN